MTQASHPPSFDALLARFEPIFARIAEGSIARENDRELPYEAVQWLKDAGFTSLRVPVEHGGSGVTLPQFFFHTCIARPPLFVTTPTPAMRCAAARNETSC